MYTLDAATLKASRALADTLQAPVIIHLAETADEIEDLAEAAQDDADALPRVARLLGAADAGRARASGSTPRTSQILARRKVGVAHNPESNMKLASGTRQGGGDAAGRHRVGLGTDGAASNNDLDMFEAMRQAAFLHKLTHERSARAAGADGARDGDDRRAPARSAWTEIGSLEAGKRADLIVVSMAGARQTPMYDPISHSST